MISNIQQQHWMVSLGHFCVLKFDTGKGYISNYSWGGMKTDRKNGEKKYLDRDEYKVIKKHIETLLKSGEKDIFPHLSIYNISAKAKHGHIKSVKQRLGIRRQTMSSQILELIESIGMDYEEIKKQTGASKEYIDQVISRNKRRLL